VLKKILALAITPTLLLTASCDKKQAEAPTGQVVATVNGKEITLLDLRHETGSANPSKAAEQAALQAIIARQLLSDQATKEELDRQPGTAMMQEKAKQLVLVDALTSKIRASVPQPSREEARQFVTDHPSSFSQRRIFLVDQLIILGNSPDLIKAIQPLDTLPEIEQMLSKRNVAFRRSVGTIDALSIDADAAEKIAALPANAVFASPEGPIIRANAIREAVVEPVTGEEAEKVALEMLRKRRSDGMVANRVNELLAQGQKAVQYNAAYRPQQKSTGATVSAK